MDQNSSAGVEDTICALSTPPINSSIGIIRISGSKSLTAAESIFTNPQKIKPREAVYGSIIFNDKKLDDVILIYYKNPSSFTGEDMVEIFCHGNQIIVHRIIEILNSFEIRMAQPGEFSKRAFLNGKIDLTEAEAINSLITATSSWEIDTALKQMHGSLKAIIDEIKEKVIHLKADIEAGIDFIEEDIEFVSTNESLKLVNDIFNMLTDLLYRCKLGETISKGINVTITGKPNVGKSSLLNLILNKERAIVSNIPGTTRDLIQESVQIDGVQINLVDTAGIDTPHDEIEKIGIELSHKNIKSSSIVIMIVDAVDGLSDVDFSIFDEISEKDKIILINKTDICENKTLSEIKERLPYEAIEFSAKTGKGLKELKEKISKIFTNEFIEYENSFVADRRVINLLENSIESNNRVIELLNLSEPSEIVAFELQSVIDYLGDITGEITPDDVLGSIFNRFCIGK